MEGPYTRTQTILAAVSIVLGLPALWLTFHQIHDMDAQRTVANPSIVQPKSAVHEQGAEAGEAPNSAGKGPPKVTGTRMGNGVASLPKSKPPAKTQATDENPEKGAEPFQSDTTSLPATGRVYGELRDGSPSAHR